MISTAIPTLRIKAIRRRTSGHIGQKLDVTVVLTSVAAALRSGSAPPDAWARCHIQADVYGVPAYDSLLRAWLGEEATDGADLGLVARFVASALRARAKLSPKTNAVRVVPDAAQLSVDEVYQCATAVRTASRIAQELGAPLADILDQVAASVQSYQQAAQARRTALAGPRTSAKVLMSLPVLAAVIATILGASPWRTYLDGAWGTFSCLLGIILMLVGRLWVNTLTSRAKQCEPSSANNGASVTSTRTWSRRKSATGAYSATTGGTPRFEIGLSFISRVANTRIRSAAPLPHKSQEVELNAELALSIVACAVNSGAPLLQALAAAGKYLGAQTGDELVSFVRAIHYGIEWDEAATPTSTIGRALRALASAWQQGASAQSTLTRLIDQMRAVREGQIQRAAARLGVHLVLPLGLCFLPAFVLIGLVPMGISLSL